MTKSDFGLARVGRAFLLATLAAEERPNLENHSQLLSFRNAVRNLLFLAEARTLSYRQPLADSSARYIYHNRRTP